MPHAKTAQIDNLIAVFMKAISFSGYINQ